MDNFQVILYVVIMIIWVIVQNVRKKKLKQQQEAQKSIQPEENEFGETKMPESRSIIDEILREIREEKGNFEEEYEDIPKPEKSKAFVKSYETEARSLEHPNSFKLLEERQRLAEKKGIRFDSYKIDKPDTDEDEEENEYANLIFEDPDSPRKAIILSEILNRKHF